MADTKISALTDGTTAAATDRIPAVRDPTGTPANRYITPAYIKDYLLALANTFTATQTFARGTITDPALVIDASVTWNDAADTFTAIRLNVTDTASNSASLLLSLQVGGSSVLSIGKTGTLQYPGTSDANLITQNGSLLLRSGSSVTELFTPVNFISGGQIRCTNDNGPHFIARNGNSTTTFFILHGEASNVLAQRNSTNAQTLRWYRTFTDSSNYERGALQTASGQVILAAETAGTGTDDIDVTLTPAGAGNVRFGSHSAIGSETVTGFITIKDSGGTTRKIAVVS